MKDPLKKLKKKELRYLLRSVLHQAVDSHYFGEPSKYRAHLWDITNTIDPKVADLLDGSAEGERKAYEITARRAGHYTEEL